LLLGLIFAGVASVNGAEPSAQPVLTRVEQIRTLSLAEAAKGYPVHLKGVITYILPQAYKAFIADPTGGVYFMAQPTDRFDVASGDEVELDGRVFPGESGPVVTAPRIRKLGHTGLRPGAPIEMQQLANGTFDAQRVEIEGVVRDAELDRGQIEGPGLYSIKVGVVDRVVRVHGPDIPGGWTRVIDSLVRISGVLGVGTNGESILFTNLPSDVRIERLGPSDPFSIPLTPIPELAHIGPGHDFANRLKIRGVVLYDRPGSFFFLAGDGANVRVSTRQAGNLNLGDIVEVAGFCDLRRRSLEMVDAEFRKIGSTSPLPPTPLTDLTYIPAEFYNRLVEVRGRMLSYQKEDAVEELTLVDRGIFYRALLPLQSNDAQLAAFRAGIELKVRGVAQVTNDELTQGQSLEILLRSGDDVTVLDKGPWFNLRQLMFLVAWLAGLLVAAAIWLLLLRRKVRQQTAIIAESFRKGAALERRYRKLFQNATDIIFSVTPDGTITSLNAAAGAVLKPVKPATPTGRKKLELLDMVSPSTRESTGNWLRRVVAEHSAPSFDLCIARRGGEQSILEVSASLAEDTSATPVIECIARDATGRKRQQQLETGSNRALELVACRAPLEETLRAVEGLVGQQIPGIACSIKVALPQAGGDGPLVEKVVRPADPGRDLHAFEGKDVSTRLEITAPDASLLGWLSYAFGNDGPGDGRTLEPDKQLAIDTAVNLAAIAIEHDLLNRRLLHLSQHDALTGLPNRLLFQDRLAQALIRVRRENKSLAVMYVDLDRFKDVNDQLGHSAGDILLVEVSRRLRAQLRESDSLARMGGDEFTLVIPDLNSGKDAELVAAKLVDSLRSPILIKGLEVFTGASVGISMYPEDSEDSSTLQRYADMAMYGAKSLGRSRYQFFKDLPVQAIPSGS
jgi:diguanylate cyclase (GGDEF)-like protein/PAS domain S-box-containing protein